MSEIPHTKWGIDRLLDVAYLFGQTASCLSQTTIQQSIDPIGDRTKGQGDSLKLGILFFCDAGGIDD